MTCSVLPTCLVDVYGIYVGYIWIDPMGTSNNKMSGKFGPQFSAPLTQTIFNP